MTSTAVTADRLIVTKRGITEIDGAVVDEQSATHSGPTASGSVTISTITALSTTSVNSHIGERDSSRLNYKGTNVTGVICTAIIHIPADGETATNKGDITVNQNLGNSRKSDIGIQGNGVITGDIVGLQNCPTQGISCTPRSIIGGYGDIKVGQTIFVIFSGLGIKGNF
ncbi:hypothetical protein AM228_28510 [Planktothricoides sp. SR001]|nr:hypothetical protein AM228_28510 [Planktothricoides sp. SR001]